MLAVTDTNVLQRYAAGVMTRASHHSPGVVEILPDVLGRILIYGKDFALRSNGTANCMWFHSRKTRQRYALSYNHKDDVIEIRKYNLQGPTLYQLSNDTTRLALDQIFAGL